MAPAPAKRPSLSSDNVPSKLRQSLSVAGDSTTSLDPELGWVLLSINVDVEYFLLTVDDLCTKGKLNI